MSNLIDRLRHEGDYMRESPYAVLCAFAADEIERLQAQIAAMTKDMESIKPWRELQRENEELRSAVKELSPYYLELAALKAKQESAEPVAIVKVWKHPIDGNHIDVSTYKAILDLPEGDYDLYVEPQTTPTAAIEDFKRRAIEAAVYVVEVEDELIVKNAIESVPLIREEK